MKNSVESEFLSYFNQNQLLKASLFDSFETEPVNLKFLKAVSCSWIFNLWEKQFAQLSDRLGSIPFPNQCEFPDVTWLSGQVQKFLIDFFTFLQFAREFYSKYSFLPH